MPPTSTVCRGTTDVNNNYSACLKKKEEVMVEILFSVLRQHSLSPFHVQAPVLKALLHYRF